MVSGLVIVLDPQSDLEFYFALSKTRAINLAELLLDEAGRVSRPHRSRTDHCTIGHGLRLIAQTSCPQPCSSKCTILMLGIAWSLRIIQSGDVSVRPNVG